ncbi:MULTISPECIES: CD3324 family protein [Clostridium]|uniref:CD3324 family protein n=1 Tax=Clostridium TaxID=1485 RepID=UPI00069D6886|nr:CD3324 family protein [Clostridium sp. DMHC 10]KOF55761.1 hypothetical protein AGR56_18255 [Clostridium sp. DMHC 10]MCD2347069.1 hypothetical protein [Clostridium guangxiense]
MKYVKADAVLPDTLVRKIQKYVQGEYIYIPAELKKRKKWGENSGNRQYIKNRNETIKRRYKNGDKITKLVEEFFLSVHSIKKIIYDKK